MLFARETDSAPGWREQPQDRWDCRSEDDRGTWRENGTPGAEVVTTNNRLYRLAPDRSELHEWTSGNQWVRIGRPFEHIRGGGERLLAVEKGSGDVLSHNPGGFFREGAIRGGNSREWSARPAYHWRKIGGPGAAFVSASAGIYGVSPVRTAVFKHLAPLRWKKTAGTATSAAVTKEQKLAKLRDFVQPDTLAFNDWARANGAQLQGIPDTYAFNRSNDGCSRSLDAPPASTSRAHASGTTSATATTARSWARTASAGGSSA